MQHFQFDHALSPSTQPRPHCARRTVQDAILARAFAARDRPQTLQIITSELAAYIPHDLAWMLAIDRSSTQGRLLWTRPDHVARNLLTGALQIEPNILHAITQPVCGVYAGHRLTGSSYDQQLAAYGLPAHVTIGLPAENKHYRLITFANQRPVEYDSRHLALLKHLLPAIATALSLPLPQPDPTHAPPNSDPQHDSVPGYSCRPHPPQYHPITAASMPVEDSCRPLPHTAPSTPAQTPISMDHRKPTGRQCALPPAPVFDLKPAADNLVNRLIGALHSTEGPHTTNIECAGSSALTAADPCDFSRAVGVLVFNAAAAVGPNGRLSLRTRVRRPHAELDILLAPPRTNTQQTARPRTSFYMPHTEPDTRFGLTIAARIARRYNASLLLRHDAHRRLTVTFSMPLVTNSDARAATLSDIHTQTGGRTK